MKSFCWILKKIILRYVHVAQTQINSSELTSLNWKRNIGSLRFGSIELSSVRGIRTCLYADLATLLVTRDRSYVPRVKSLHDEGSPG